MDPDPDQHGSGTFAWIRIRNSENSTLPVDRCHTIGTSKGTIETACHSVACHGVTYHDKDVFEVLLIVGIGRNRAIVSKVPGAKCLLVLLVMMVIVTPLLFVSYLCIVGNVRSCQFIVFNFFTSFE